VNINGSDELFVKANVPYIPYYLHNYTSLYDEDQVKQTDFITRFETELN
jgi:hypothetical protein